MAKNRRPAKSRPSQEPPAASTLLPVISTPTSQFAEVARVPTVEAPIAPRTVERGVVVFDLDGTIMDDIGHIAQVAADCLERAFGTPAAEGRLHYLATTGMPFEAQLAQLYPEVPASDRDQVSRIFHQRKVQEAYANAGVFPEVPRVLKQLDREKWTLVVSTGAERETAELVLEREGIRFWFEGVLGSGQGTKREHLAEYRRRFPGASLYLVGDSRFDMEAAASTPGVVPIGRASSFDGWTLTPADLERWGAKWADYSLAGLPEALDALDRGRPPAGRPVATTRKK